MARLPADLQSRISSAQVVCLGPEGQHPEAALEQALWQAAEAAAPLLPQLHQVQASALLQVRHTSMYFSRGGLDQGRLIALRPHH